MKWNKSMNIETANINRTQDTQTTKVNSSSNKDSSTSFAEELKASEGINEGVNEGEKEIATNDKSDIVEEKTPENKKDNTSEEEKVPLRTETPSKTENENINLNEQELGKAIEGLNQVVNQFNQTEDNSTGDIKTEDVFADKNNVINNDYNIQDNKDILPQMNPNMNFSGNGQPFSSFMNNDSEQNKNSNGVLGASAQDLAEEAAILSTMAENIAIANKNQALKDTRTITNSEGVKKVNTQTGIKIESVVKFDTVIMNQADVEVFANLVENGEVNLNNLAPKAAEKSIQVSKTLADLLAKSMETNQPVRIDFDNNISVIIRISRDGKITADFLPSSQIAEAYLKENLPILRQRFDENNIEYDSLNQRERRNQEKEQNKKKGHDNE